MKAFANALKDDGTLLVDYLNVPNVLANLVREETVIKNGVAFNLHRRVHEGWIEKSIQFNWNGSNHHHVERVQALTLDDFQTLFSSHNLGIEKVFGDYELQPWTEQSPLFDDCQEKQSTFAAMIVTSLIFLLTTLVGGALFQVMGKRGIHDMSLFMAFGGAFIIGMSFLHLLPEAFAATPKAGLFVLLGFVIQIFLEFLSNGIEHGHHHPHQHTDDCHEKPVLRRIPWLAFLSLALHATLESMPVIDHGHDHHGHVQGVSRWT